MMSERKEPAKAVGRAENQLREQYELEKRLAEKLRSSTKEERKELYKLVYDELFRTTAHHPQTLRKSQPDSGAQKAASQIAVLKHFLRDNTGFIEIGAGDCQLALKVAEIAGRVCAVEVSQELTKGLNPPANFELVIGDACSLDVPAQSFDLAYSYQVIEHLHPDDCLDHLAGVRRALVPGGKYLCITPNKLNGPWDISRSFDIEAKGLHLREYTNFELAAKFREAGFKRVQVYVRAKGLHLELPMLPIMAIEIVLKWLPVGIRRKIADWYPIRRILGINLVGTR